MTITANDLLDAWTRLLGTAPKNPEWMVALYGSREELLAALVIHEKAFEDASLARAALAEGALLSIAPLKQRRKVLATTPGVQQVFSGELWKLVVNGGNQNDDVNQMIDSSRACDFPETPESWRFLGEAHDG